ncbi:MAG TPA: glucodextranase DOMON-like domain-containing protein [Anaerolineae bacterium]|nr:glucodextranase DOMON-like domain-containing protein [Anaerolineae bacterium]
MIFRDWTISDKVGFTYSGMPGEAAAADVMKRLENIRAQLKSSGAAGPHLVSIILDGENAWENYDNDGKAFLNALYQKLSESPTVKTVTPSEYLEMFPQQQVLPNPLFQGAWFSANYDTWIGEDEEAVAWNHLVKTRQTLAAYDIAQTKTTTPEKLAQALDFMYLAEGSDWFWWYGADQDSGNDDYFDYGFRALLGEVYKALDEPAPDFVQAPIIPKRVAVPARQPAGPFTPVIDGRETAPDEWARAGVYHVVGGALYCGLDAKNLYVRADAKGQWTDLRDVTLGLYVRVPGVPGVNAFSRASAAAEAKTVLGIGATHLVEVDLTAETPALYTASGALGAWKEAKGDVSAAVDGGVLELALPLELLGQLQPGDDLRLVAVTTCAGRDLDLLPAAGPAQLVVPDLGTTTALITVDDPQGDDNGPGSYTYPTDGVFEAGVFDITQFTAGYDAKNVVFKVSFNGPLPNPWGSGNNLSLQTLDIYVDKDPGAATGNRLLLPGRNAALEKGNGWDVMVWAEGWTPGIYAPDAKGTPQKVGYEPKIIVDPAARMVTLRVPREAFGSGFDPAKAGYAAVVMSQDGYPAAGVWRVRDVEAKAAQWRLGGAPADTNHTRIIDVAWPEGARPAQAEFLASYPASQEANMDKLTPDDFCQVPLLTAQGPQT